MRLSRRLLFATAALTLLAACASPSGTVPDDDAATQEKFVQRLTYGEDASQWADLFTPTGPSRGVVVVIHGGFWKAQYDASLGAPLAEDLRTRGWTVLNVEYRRTGNGGGFPATFDDIAAAIDLLPDAGVDTSRVITLGHSAGGHLAAWAAARTRFEEWSGGVEVTHVIAQAGVLDLTTAQEQGLGDGAVDALMAVDPNDTSYGLADPTRQIPLAVPLWAVHAPDDDTVPMSQSTDYVAAAVDAGAEATLIEVTGGHFGLIDTQSPAWAAIVAVLDGLG